MLITIHQPEHLPWLGLIDKISRVDLFVILDTVQFRKNYFQNRNKVRIAKGFSWLTVPIKKSSLNTSIRDIEISYNQNWIKHYLNLLKEAYGKSNFFNPYFSDIEFLIDKRHKLLSDLNYELIIFLVNAFKLNVKIIRASDLDLPVGIEKGHALIYEICKAVSADEYLSGISGKDYLDQECFDKGGIKITYQEFYHPIYQQLHEPFMSCMSSIEMLFIYGDEASTILFSESSERLAYLIP